MRIIASLKKLKENFLKWVLLYGKSIANIANFFQCPYYYYIGRKGGERGLCKRVRSWVLRLSSVKGLGGRRIAQRKVTHLSGNCVLEDNVEPLGGALHRQRTVLSKICYWI